MSASGDGAFLPDADTKLWVDATAALSPDKSLARMADSARFVVSTVAVVTTLLAGFGVATADELRANRSAECLAILAISASCLALIFALIPLILRTRQVNTRDIAEVRLWFADQLRRSWLVTIAGLLLTIGVLLAGAAGVVALARPTTHSPEGQLFASAKPSRTWELGGEIACNGCQRNKILSVTVTAAGGTSASRTVFSGQLRTDGNGNLKLALPTDVLPARTDVRLSVEGRLLAEIHLS